MEQSNYFAVNTFGNYLWVKGKIPRKIRKYFKVNVNENEIYQKLQDAAREFTALKVYFRKEERCKINNLRFLSQEAREKEQSKPKISRKKEKLKIEVEINERGKQKNNIEIS